MEKVLDKLAKQINAYDEASLTSMWEKYAEIVRNFEPTKRWEEAALILGLIQAVRMKNQLFNYNWAQCRTPASRLGEDDFPRAAMIKPEPDDEKGSGPGGGPGSGKRGKLLRLRPRKDG